MKHFAIHKLSKTQPSLLSKVSDRLCCGDMDSAVYFYHSDHLGSASWITNGSGTPIQHLQYMPYGEPFVNERTTGYEERFCSPLLHYCKAYRANSCGNAIAKPLAFYCSPLLCYRFVSTTLTAQIPNGNAIAKPQALLHTGKERDSETGFSYFGARYYDSDILTGWLSVDPMADKYPSLSPYAYSNWNPIKLIDPDGNSPISVLAKMMLKRTAKEGAQIYAKKQIENRLKKYMTKDIAKQFAKDLDDILTTLDNDNILETVFEFIPFVGDIYGAGKFVNKVAKVYEKLQDLENKYVERIYKLLPKKEAEKFKRAMRNAGVRNARNDQKNEVKTLAETYSKGNSIEGHHKVLLSRDVSQSSDPRNIEFMSRSKHQEIHKTKTLD